MYLNQKALWSPVTIRAIQNPYGDVVNSGEIAINVRRQEHVEEVRTSDGALKRTNFIYYTDASVKVNDRLDGYLVVDMYIMRTLDGREKMRRLKTV